MSFETRRLTSDFGIEVIGLDLERPLGEAVRERLFQTWIDGGILLVRGVRSMDAHLRFSRYFGTPEQAAVPDNVMPENPLIMLLTYDPDSPKSATMPLYEVDGEARAGYLGWHWDQSFMPVIVRGAAMRMIRTARSGGRTGFIDAVATYDRLPQPLKDRIEGLEVVYQLTADQENNRFGFPESLKVARPRPNAEAKIAQLQRDFPPVVHPLVITQAETGRKVLKLSPMHAKYVLGLDARESDALLTELANHMVDERHAYFHEWRDDDLIIWDNWRMIHCTTGVPLDCDRLAHRTTIIGDYGEGRYLDPALSGSQPTAHMVD